MNARRIGNVGEISDPKKKTRDLLWEKEKMMAVRIVLDLPEEVFSAFRVTPEAFVKE